MAAVAEVIDIEDGRTVNDGGGGSAMVIDVDQEGEEEEDKENHRPPAPTAKRGNRDSAPSAPAVAAAPASAAMPVLDLRQLTSRMTGQAKRALRQGELHSSYELRVSELGDGAEAGA